ncbi:MAG TPA: hypothetical protein VFK82_04070 [Burkholderiaceae bacterium]|nr:hypothetical protein [Burkholderiaceae bacterium]
MSLGKPLRGKMPENARQTSEIASAAGLMTTMGAPPAGAADQTQPRNGRRIAPAAWHGSTRLHLGDSALGGVRPDAPRRTGHTTARTFKAFVDIHREVCATPTHRCQNQAKSA